MKSILAWLLYAVMVAVGCSLLFQHGLTTGQARAQLACQQARADQLAQAQDEMDRAGRDEAAARQEIHREAQRLQQRAQADAIAAERSRIGLQQRAQAYASAATPAVAPTAAEPASPAAAPACLVLADVLGWADARAAEAAAALDAAHAAGTTCQREHDAAVSAAN